MAGSAAETKEAAQAALSELSPSVANMCSGSETFVILIILQSWKTMEDHVQLCDHVIEQLGHGIKKNVVAKATTATVGALRHIFPHTATFIPQLAAMFFWKE